MKIYLLAIGFLIYLIPLEAQQAFSVEGAVEYAIKNSTAIKLDNISIARAEQDIKEYYALGLPKLNGTIDYQHFLEIPVSFVPAEFFGGVPGEFAELQFGLANSVNAGLNFSTLLFDGSFFTGLKAQKVYRKLTKRSITQTEYEIRSQVTEAYINVLLTYENIKILDKNLINLEKSITETKAFYEAGFVEKLDIDRLELSYDNLLSQRKTLERFTLLGLNLLKFQMNYPLDKEINLQQSLDDVVDKVLVIDVQISDKPDFSKRPEYEAILLGQELNHINLKANKNTRYPSLAGFANYQQQLQRNNLFSSNEPGFTPISIIGLQLNVPIYNGGAKNVAIQKVKLDIEKTEIQKQDFERGVQLQIQNSYQQYLNARENMFSAKKRESLATEIYDITVIKYKEGVGSSIETSQAEREVYAAQQQYIQSLFDLVTSKLNLDKATGDISKKLY